MTSASGETFDVTDEVAVQLAREGLIPPEQLPPRLRPSGEKPAPQDPLRGVIPRIPQEVLDLAVPDILPGPLGPGHPSMRQTSAEDDVIALFRDPKFVRLLIEMGLPAGVARSPRAAIRMLQEIGAEGAASLIAETVDPTEAPAFNAGVQALIGLGVGSAGAGFQRVRRGSSGRQVSDLGIKADEVARSRGVTRGLTPGQLTESALVDTLESIAEAGLLGRPILAKSRKEAVDAATLGLAEFADSLLSAPTEQVGRALADAVKGGRRAWLATGDALYKRAEQLVPDLSVDLGPVLGRAGELAEESKELAPSVSRLRNEVARVMGDVESGGVSFEEARRLRSRLLRIERGAEGDIVSDDAEKAAGELARLITERLDVAFRNADPSDTARRAWKRANDFFKAGSSRFDKELIRTVGLRDPEALYKFAIKGQSPTQIREIRNAVTKRSGVSGQTFDPDGMRAWELVQGRAMRDVLLDAGLRETGLAAPGEESLAAIVRSGGSIKPGAVVSAIRRFGDEALREIFRSNPKGFSQFRENADLLIRATTPPSKQRPLSVALSLGQARGISDVGGGLLMAFGAGRGSPGTFATGASLIFGPAALAKFLTNPGVKRWLTTGLDASTSTDLAFQSAARLTALAIESGAFPLDRPDPRRNTRGPRTGLSATISGPQEAAGGP